jgi:sterol desaturase/sphingolipid hydroxylase (fatty acid hydroxylase superfamily)
MLHKLRHTLRQELDAPSQLTHLGQGWISGVLALTLSLVALTGVLCLHYPEILTVPMMREHANVQMVHLLLQAVLTVAFLFACTSLILRQNKALGFSAIMVVLASVSLGEVAAARHSVLSGRYYLGLDWFSLNLFLTGILYIPLERLFRRVDQTVFRFEWREDLFYFFVTSVLVQALTFLTLTPAMTLQAHLPHAAFFAWVAHQPLLFQIIEIMFFTDLVQYWVHRLFHRIPFLWGFHSIHHSAKAMDWMASSRMHFLEIVLLRGTTVIPMYALGFKPAAMYAYIFLVYLSSTYIHSNVKFDIEWLKPLIVTPRFHHWHHGIEKEAIDVNFAIHFSWIDRLFGTYHMPKSRWPQGYGISYDIPKGFWKQFLYPFQKSS